MKFGFHVGGFLEYAFNERLSLQPEILYSAQGTDLDCNMLNKLSITGYYSLNYINIPVLLKINIAEGLSAEIGPQVGFLISSYRTITLKDLKTSAELEIAGGITSKSNKVDFTAAFGLSYTFAENFVVSARYGLGFTKVSKTPENKWKNGVIQLSVGYKFNSSK